MHCLPMGEYTEKILLAMLFSIITLSGSIEEWKEGMGEHSTSQGWREEKRQESKELLRSDPCSSRTLFRVQYDIPFQVSLARLHPSPVYTVYPKLQSGSNSEMFAA